MSLPHRSPDPIPEAVVRNVAQRADELGFQDLWVTNNTVDLVDSFDSFTVLTYAAALTTRIRLGVSVLVLPTYHPVHVAHVVASLDRLSGGRATLGVGLGRHEEYALFQVPVERRVRRFTESIELIRALWSGDDVTYDGEIFAAATRTWARARCSGRRRRSGSAASTPTPCAVPRASATGGWAPAARAPRRSPRRSRCSARRWPPRVATRRRSPCPSGSSCPSTSGPTSPAPRSSGGSRPPT